jgi:hypothetical protein
VHRDIGGLARAVDGGLYEDAKELSKKHLSSPIWRIRSSPYLNWFT